ncbi:hypothetical protein [Kaistella sp.]|uniref:hypothetical protein n=1 Tax=Kaistella sp. TaxID=2782235 RepID=UPI003C3D2B2B
MKKIILVVVLLSFALPLQAQRHPKEEACFEKLRNGEAKGLRGICEHVITPDFVNDELSYITRFKKAAGVLPEDSEEEVNRKIRQVWSEYEDCLTCDTIAFSLRGGSILKAAHVSGNATFYRTVIKWGVNLNRIDPVDGKTVLDFFRDELNKNPPGIEFYRVYYNVLKEHGAKHASEILTK